MWRGVRSSVRSTVCMSRIKRRFRVVIPSVIRRKGWAGGAHVSQMKPRLCLRRLTDAFALVGRYSSAARPGRAIQGRVVRTHRGAAVCQRYSCSSFTTPNTLTLRRHLACCCSFPAASSSHEMLFSDVPGLGGRGRVDHRRRRRPKTRSIHGPGACRGRRLSRASLQSLGQPCPPRLDGCTVAVNEAARSCGQPRRRTPHASPVPQRNNLMCDLSYWVAAKTIPSASVVQAPALWILLGGGRSARRRGAPPPPRGCALDRCVFWERDLRP